MIKTLLLLEQEKIEDLLNLRTNEDFNFLKDEALKGNKKKTNKLLSDTVFENENYIFYLNIINQRVKKLNEIDNLITSIIVNKNDINKKIDAMKKISYENSWNNINQKLINTINEN